MSFLSALRDAIEETLAEKRDQGVSADTARDALRNALSRAQEAADAARERLDFATRSEMDQLRKEVRRLAARVEVLERAGRRE